MKLIVGKYIGQSRNNHATAYNNVYMKRFIPGSISRSIVDTEDKITTYETYLKPSHASHTLNRWAQ